MTRHIIKGSILAVWAVLMVWWWHEHRSWPEPEKIDAVFLPDYLDNFGLEYGGRKVGWADKSLRRLQDGSYQAGESATILLELSGHEVEVRLESSAELDPSFNLVGYRYLLQAGPLSLLQTGTVKEGRLTVDLNLGQYREMVESLYADYAHLLGERAAVFNPGQVNVPAPKGPALASLFPHYIAAQGLKAGQTFTLAAFDPFTRSLVSVNARVESETRLVDQDTAREVPAFELGMAAGSGAAASREIFMINRHGRVFTEDGPMGYRLSRTIDENEARRGVVPLAPPAPLQGLLSTGPLKDLMTNIIRERLGD
ncbi:hypothetical protein C4J81_03370 [Deltaproteobacteria bacterium Smac51]|nr:hypothetical protein C4J81_03370 [Deltaproteobacteria bacterium Smac51]